MTRQRESPGGDGGVGALGARRKLGGYSRALLSLLALLITIGVYADYIDAQTRAAQLYVAAYVGPGFYVAVAGTALIILSAVLVWRVRD